MRSRGHNHTLRSSVDRHVDLASRHLGCLWTSANGLLDSGITYVIRATRCHVVRDMIAPLRIRLWLLRQTSHPLMS